MTQPPDSIAAATAATTADSLAAGATRHLVATDTATARRARPNLAADSAATTADTALLASSATAPTAADSVLEALCARFGPDSVPLYRTATLRSLGGYPARRAPFGPSVDGATAALCALGLLLTLCIAAGSRRYLGQTLTALRHDTQQRRGALDEQSGQRIVLGWLLLPIAALAGALLFGEWARAAHPEIVEAWGHGWTAACGAAAVLAALGLRHVLQRLAGYIFFTDTARRRWRRLQAPALLLLDLLLLGVAAAGLHFDLDARTSALAAGGALLAADALLLARARHIFFGHKGGLLHLFLYFCATEAAPLAVAARLLQLALGELSAQTFCE